MAAAMLTVPPKSTSASGARVEALVSKLNPADSRPEQAVARLGGRVTHAFSVIDGFSADLPAAALQRLSQVPGVRWVTPNRSLKLLGQYGQDSGVASAVYTDVTRASKAWSQGVTGTGVTVALIDTGVDTSGDLAGQVKHAEDFTAEQDNHDNFGHGTFVAGLIAGTGAGSSGAIKGVAPDAKIVSLKIAGRDGATDVTHVLEALEWVVTFKDVYGIKIANLSLGFDSQQSYLIDPLDYAVERVWNDGVVVITAAGNGGNTAGTVTAPGNDPYVITVGASNDRTSVTPTDDRLATFSSSGPTVDGLAKPDVVAPGRSVVSSRSPGSNIDVANPDSAIGTNYGKGSGSSFSTGVVSGAAALILSRAPGLTPDQVKNRITTTARAMTGGNTPGTGSGEIDAFAATMSLDTTSANQGVTPGAGGGSLQATRGPACLRDETGNCMSDADADASTGFDEAAYFDSDWAGSQWVGSQWVGSQWVGTDWQGSQWIGSQWVGSQWVGSQWVGSQWVGSQWVGSQWVAWTYLAGG
jgi:serine protease AprX